MTKTSDCVAWMLRWEERAEGYLADSNRLSADAQRAIPDRAERLLAEAQLRAIQARIATDAMKAWATLAGALKEPRDPHE